MILVPGDYRNVPAYTLLEAAGRGTIAVDHRLLHAILDEPDRAIPELVRFAAAEHENDPVDLEPQLIDIFRYLKTPQALPFLIQLVRRAPTEVSDELTEAFIALGAAAVDPLLGLLKQLADPGDVPFLLSELGVRDPRILDLLVERLATDPFDAALCLEIYGDAAAMPALEAALANLPPGARSRPMIQAAIQTLRSGVTGVRESLEPFDIWEQYPETAWPVFEVLTDDDRLAMLSSDSAEIRARVAQSYAHQEPPLGSRAKLLELARSDPETAVRGTCWEGLSEISDEPEIRRALLGVLRDQAASIEEKGGAAVALALESDNPAVVQAIEALYHDPRSRVNALKAMARSLNRRYASYPGKHLDDPDPDVLRQAIWGIGYLGLSSDAPRLAPLFEQEKFRSDALFCYALAIPGDTSRGRVHALLDKIEDAAGGFSEDEEELVQIALDQRLILHGMSPVFFPDGPDLEEQEAPPASSSKVGRNDPCPCGSGKKYKKCCGA